MNKVLGGFFLLFIAPAASAQITLDLGGTGAYGPLNITKDTTVQLPPDGVIQATTVNIAAGATLTFGKNARNTGAVIVATGDVIINGTIDVSGGASLAGTVGVGGPGGGDGGRPVVATPYSGADYWNVWFYPPNDGSLATAIGNNGGYGSRPYATSQALSCTTFGAGGGGGGGALYVFSNTKIISTQPSAINASGGLASPALPSGGNCIYNAPLQATNGTDGVVRLVAPVINAAPLTINVLQGGTVRIQRLPAIGGLPTTKNAYLQTVAQTVTDGVDSALPSPLIVSIMSVDGSAAPATTDTWNYVYTTGATSTAVVTNVSGCSPGKTLTISLQSYGFVSNCTPDRTTFPNIANATQTWTCALAPSPSTGKLFASATCQ